MVDGRKLVNVDNRFPASLTGEAGKQLVVNAGETGYEHGVSDVGAPRGSLILYMFNNLPVGYIPVGATYNYDDYPDLGAMFGASAGETFDVPEILFIKNSGGVSTGTVETEEVGPHGHAAEALPAHGHSASATSVGNHTHSGVYDYAYSGQYDIGGSKTGVDLMIAKSTNSGGAHGHVITVADDSAGTPVVLDNTGTKNQPECTLINIGIKF